MKATVIPALFGLLAFDEDNRLVARSLFPKKPEEAAKTMLEIESGKAVKEVADLIAHLKNNGYTTFVFENPALAAEVKEKFAVSTEFLKVSEAGQLLRSNIENYAIETSFVKDYEEFQRWMHSVSMEIAKLKVKGAVEKRDLLVAQAIQSLDDLDKTINLFMSRVREWYGVHFPELDRLLEKHETYVRLVVNFGNREGFHAERLEKEGLPRQKAEQIDNAAKSSMGADLSDRDLAQIQALARTVLGLYDLRESMEKYIDDVMEEVAPNVKALTGALLGARLIALAGGLANLAKMPASTLQVLGAEKALFRSLKTGTRPPKHGIIFQHPYLHEAKKWQRGKIARALAGKLAIAARTDVFGGRYIGEELKADLEKRIEEIRQKYAEPPKAQKAPEKKPKPKHEKKRWKGKHAS
ncbi:MAG: C/D box methylation guide ribonucleoprotein complex aNOP56 subunit [Candidatus Bathyarchaeota archaeon]|nr:C/D box methylation guide ribonucleoprotein complex aNOP56 subunit [Candidatus Bathyarchaeota archaeon]MDW8040935.1 C/D box methylation guide ribonucleoprotein complex aNOP56 subunit [Nitrososphaerota archaeon]